MLLWTCVGLWACCCGHLLDCEHAAVDMCRTVSMLLWTCIGLWACYCGQWIHTHTHTWELKVHCWSGLQLILTSLHFTVVSCDIYATPSFSVINLDLKLWMQSSVGPKVLCIRCWKIQISINLKLRVVHFLFVCIAFHAVYNYAFSHLTVPQ